MSLLNDTLMEYIDQALEDSPSNEEKVDVIDRLITSLEYRKRELSQIRVHFQPEAWINDYAVAVDDQGQDIWVVTDETADLIRGADDSGDLDFVRSDDNAPSWVKDWTGPFTITVVDDNGINWIG